MKSSHNVFLERDFTVGETACASPACHRRASVSGLRKGEGVPVAGHLLGGLWLPRMPGDRPCGDAGRPWWPGGGARGARRGTRRGTWARALELLPFSRPPGPPAPTPCTDPAPSCPPPTGPPRGPPGPGSTRARRTTAGATRWR